jgi:hypothetical protein
MSRVDSKQAGYEGSLEEEGSEQDTARGHVARNSSDSDFGVNCNKCVIT